MTDSIQDIIKRISPYYAKKGEPETSHFIGYDSSSETLEPIYFWIVDFLDSMGFKPEKLVDNFTSSPGSGHFSELGQRRTIMQQQGGKLLADANAVLRSVLNLVYDLKEFKIRLQSYEDYKSSDKDRKEAALLSLKQIWMDKVDISKGNSSIKAMATSQMGFQTLIDAFLLAKDAKDADKIDLNDRVKRLVKARVEEFNMWLKHSEVELRKRYEMERTYLKSQVNSLKLYSRWAKPYLRAAQQLESKEGGRNAALVKVFNTIFLELTLFGKRKVDIKEEALSGNLPREFIDEKIEKNLSKRKYYECILVDFNFRGIPQKVGGQAHYAFGGKAEVTFQGYALNEDEIKKLDEELDKSDIEEMLGLIEGSTTESLEKLQEEIDFFLKEQEKEENKEGEKIKDKSNPFVALFGGYNKKEKTKKKETKKGKKDLDKAIKKETWVEKNHIRPLAAYKASDDVFTVFDKYKKAHGMNSYT